MILLGDPRFFETFEFETCTVAHKALVDAIHKWAWRNHNLKVQIAANECLERFRGSKPRPIVAAVRDDDQKDTDEYRDFGGY